MDLKEDGIYFISSWEKRYLKFTLSEFFHFSSLKILIIKSLAKIVNPLFSSGGIIALNLGRIFATDDLKWCRIEIYLDQCYIHSEQKWFRDVDNVIYDTILHESMHSALLTCGYNSEKNCYKACQILKLN